MDGLHLAVLSKSNAFKRTVVPGNMSADLMWNDTSVAVFTLDDDDPAIPALRAAGARCIVRDAAGELFRGRVDSGHGTGPNGQIDFTVKSDHRKFSDWLVWPNSASAITSQTSEQAVYTGTSEKVFKDALQATVTRLAVGWTVATNTNRGTSTKAAFRMATLKDVVFPLLSADQIGVTLAYGSGGAVTVDVREPETIHGVLNVATGVVDQYTYDPYAPTATRVIVGGRGGSTSRAFYQKIDTAREAAWGDIIEVFVDAGSTETSANLQINADAALLDGAPGMSVAMDLTETDRFRFRTHYQLGDLVPYDLGGATGSELITQINITDTADSGVIVTPHIGKVHVDDPIAQLGARITALRARVRDLGRR